jgi:hypothetical protein
MANSIDGATAWATDGAIQDILWGHTVLQQSLQRCKDSDWTSNGE